MSSSEDDAMEVASPPKSSKRKDARKLEEDFDTLIDDVEEDESTPRSSKRKIARKMEEDFDTFIDFTGVDSTNAKIDGTPGRPRKMSIGTSYSEYKKEEIHHFLELIERNPSLWSGIDKNYHRTDVNNAIWKALEKETKFLKTTRNGKAENAKKLWNELLKDYKKALKLVRERPSGSGASITMKFPYFTEMEFVQQSMKDREPTSSWVIGADDVVLPPPEKKFSKRKMTASDERPKNMKEEFLGKMEQANDVFITCMKQIVKPKETNSGFAQLVNYITNLEKNMTTRDVLMLNSKLFNTVFDFEREMAPKSHYRRANETEMADLGHYNGFPVEMGDGGYRIHGEEDYRVEHEVLIDGELGVQREGDDRTSNNGNFVYSDY